jgi:Leucine-rich repeat (LRR) protein
LPDTVFVDDDSSIWPNMTKLELYDNALGGPIPRWIGNLSRLTDLDLSCNALVGPIPAELGRVPGLALLNLWNNSLSGEIPESLANLTRLRIFQVFQNELAGVIPGAIGASSGSLEIFDVSSNYALSGGVPARLCDGGSLVKLIAFSNALSGSFPAGYGRCPTLARVRMQGNLLSGSVSDSVWELPNLNYLDLSDNNLSGPVLLLRDPPDPPTTTPAIAPIAYLLLARNSFSGDLPDAIGRFGLLEVLDLSGNRLSGSVPAALADCLRLQKLILGSNALSGPIPGDLASGLQSLDLSGNRFSGAIPESLGGLAMLSTLNLSSNHLSGAVPESLAQLRASLDAFDASFNELSGELPFALGGPFTAESFRGNPGLCINIGCGSGVGGGAMGAAGKPDKTRWIIASLLLIFSFLAAAAAAAAACWWCYLRKARRELWQRIEDNGIGSSSSSRLRYSPKDWTLTPFEKVGFTVHEILRSLDDEDAILGKGASGRVYLCKLDNGTAVAIKKLREQDRGQKQRHRDHGFGAEVATLGRVRHANVVRLICCCTDSRTATNLLVFEYMPNGSLGDALFGHGGVIKGKNNPHLLGWDLRLRIALGSARGLAYLHHDCVPPIVHRDVKSSNILLDARFDAHIADFGLAKSIPDSPADVKALQNSGVVGSVGYMAPGTCSLLAFFSWFLMIWCRSILSCTALDICVSVESPRSEVRDGYLLEIMRNMIHGPR